MNTEKRYYDEIKRMKLNNENNDLIEALELGISSYKIFNALRAIYLIAFNAKILKKDCEDNSMVQVLYQYGDMDYAVLIIRDLIPEYNENGFRKDKPISVTESCLNMLKKYYQLAATDEEINSKSGMVKNDSIYNNQLSGVTGKHYNFNDIQEDSWEGIKKYIIARV